MSSVNKVILLGNLGADPEIRHTQDGRKVVSFRIATSQAWKDKSSGERREKTEWHSVVCFNEGLAGIAEKCLHKGSKVWVEGQLQTRKWQDQSGQDRYTTEVVLQGFNSSLVLLDAPKQNPQDNPPPGGKAFSEPRTARKSMSEALDDDLPF